ncbi:unnamed protein product [Brachionus calyciflorus]|uniref:DUF268 domain-containing protein n=1 Tax=Brachionus calyciflorus TaxID=104777 RepID=A0A814CLW1_9BILA|nr:unnamed protein product [Brachionus calyciflorus]
MITQKKIIICTIGILVFVLVYLKQNTSVGSSINIEQITNGLTSSTYEEKCLDLFKKQRHPNEKLINRPPLKEIPADMIDDFTMQGKMPNTQYWYFNDAYSDSDSNNKTINYEYSIMEIAQLVENVKNKIAQPHYGDKVLNDLIGNHSNYIKDKSVVVIGTQFPWVEAIAYYHGASHITTLDYTRKKYRVANMSWYHVNDFLDEHIKSRKLEEFDVAISFSSIEHSGLGRYGDPLNPNGDIEAMQQMHCLLKPGGLVFLAVPASSDGKSYMQFNAHRVYGTARLEAIFNGWELLNKTWDSSGIHGIYILKKIQK